MESPKSKTVNPKSKIQNPMIRLLLVDDQIIIRQGLKSLLELKPDFEIVGRQKTVKVRFHLLRCLTTVLNNQIWF